jgi:hypothetical protein
MTFPAKDMQLQDIFARSSTFEFRILTPALYEISKLSLLSSQFSFITVSTLNLQPATMAPKKAAAAAATTNSKESPARKSSPVKGSPQGALKTTGEDMLKSPAGPKTTGEDILQLPPPLKPAFSLALSSVVPTTTLLAGCNLPHAKAPRGLATFGLTPAKAPVNGGGVGGTGGAAGGGAVAFPTPHDRSSRLRACIIKSYGVYTLVLRVQPSDHTSRAASWQEKLLTDAVKYQYPWARELNFDPNLIFWFHENSPQVNPKGYNIRLFTIRIESDSPPIKGNLVALAKFICDQLNAIPGNQNSISVDEHSFFWLPDGAVWSDIMGIDAALAALFKEQGYPTGPEWFESNRSTVYTYFRPGTFSREMIQLLYAPLDELHPSIAENASTSFHSAYNCEEDNESMDGAEDDDEIVD